MLLFFVKQYNIHVENTIRPICILLDQADCSYFVRSRLKKINFEKSKIFRRNLESNLAIIYRQDDRNSLYIVHSHFVQNVT